MPGWTNYFMGFARHAATRSKDSTKVGCVVIGASGQILTTGYNGIPRGVTDAPERMERPAKYLWTSHAEENAVAHAALTGTSLQGAHVYVTHHPCARCARSLIQAGVATVTYGDGTTSMPEEEFEVARKMFEEAEIDVRHHVMDEEDHAGDTSSSERGS